MSLGIRSHIHGRVLSALAALPILLAPFLP